MARSSRAGGAIGSDDYTGFSLILIVVGLCILGWAGWQVWHAEISRIALLVAHCRDAGDRRRDRPLQARRHRGSTRSSRPGSVRSARATLSQHRPGVRLSRHGAGSGAGGLCFLRAGNARFTRTFDLEKLMAEQAIHSRSTAAFVGRGLKLSKLRAGDPRPADAALHVDEWVARYATSEKSGFDEAAARREFMRQLGGRWTGPAAASQPVRCNARGLRPAGRPAPRRSGSRCLDSCRKGCRARKADGGAGPEEPLAFDPKTLRLADRVLATVEVAAWAFEVMEKHHFTTPGLMSVLNQARLRSGVLAPAQFAFLKLVDRRLWYALHALGFEFGRAHCSPPSEHAGRGDRRGRPLGGRTRGRRADSDPGIRFRDRRDPPQRGRVAAAFRSGAGGSAPLQRPLLRPMKNAKDRDRGFAFCIDHEIIAAHDHLSRAFDPSRPIELRVIR